MVHPQRVFPRNLATVPLERRFAEAVPISIEVFLNLCKKSGLVSDRWTILQ